MSSPTRPAVRRLASVLAATALLTGGIVAGTGTAAASLPVTDVCGGCGQPPGSAEIAMREATTAVLNPVLVPLLSAYKSIFNNTGSLAE